MKVFALFLTTTLLLIRLVAVGQQPVMFDTVRFNQVGSFAIGYAVFPIDTGYLVFGNQKGVPGLSQDIYTTRFDHGGGLIDERTFASYQQDDWGSCSPIARGLNSYYAGVSHFGLLGPNDSLFLYRYALDGDTLWTKFIATDSSLVQNATYLSPSSDILLGGAHYPPLEAYIFHLDSLGNIKGYHGYPGFDGEDVVEGKDGKWYLCGRGNHMGNYSKPVIIKSDTSGNELWRRTAVNYGVYSSLITLRDSGVVALGVDLSNDGLATALVRKFRSNGDVAWTNHARATINDIWPCNMNVGYENPDSSLIVAGWLRDTTYRDAGMLFKLDPEGNTVWCRFYSHYPGAAYGKDQIFWDVKPTSDGGMVLTGETNSDDYPYAQLWLLKLDSMGCLVPGCGSVGVQEYLDVLQPLLHVSPNPASDQVNMSLDLPQGASTEGELQVLLLDATGKLVLQQHVQQNLNQLRATMDVSALPAGTYYLHLRDGKRWLAGSKVVVE